MALSKQGTSQQTGAIGTYWRVRRAEITYSKDTEPFVAVQLGLFVNKDASDSGKDPIAQESMNILLSQIDQTKDPRISVYSHIKTLDGWGDAVDA